MDGVMDGVWFGMRGMDGVFQGIGLLQVMKIVDVPFSPLD
jgi:hypothetical protein